MTVLERSDVVAAAGAWILEGPPGTRAIEGAGWKVVHLPYGAPDLLQLLWVRTERPVSDVLDEVRASVVDIDEDAMLVYVKLDAPAGLETELVCRGASLVDACDVLAMPVTAGEAQAGASTLRLQLKWRTTSETARAIAQIMVEAFGGVLPSGDDLDEALESRAREGRADKQAGRGGALLATLGGIPVGTASLEIVDGVARFAGGAVRPEYQRRGIYRAMVHARMAYAAENGAHLALSFGRVTTSSPILKRIGFETFGQEHMYRLAIRRPRPYRHSETGRAESDADANRTFADMNTHELDTQGVQQQPA